MSYSPGKPSRQPSSLGVVPLPSLNRMNTLGSNASTRSLFAPTPKQTNVEMTDDIDCREWLAEIGLEHYTNTFLTNLSSDGLIILRRRLSNIRQQDLSQMNITDFDDQKAIMAHIKLVLKHPFNSAVRKRELAVSEPVVMLKTRQASMALPKSPPRQNQHHVAMLYADGKEHDDHHYDHHHKERRRSSKDISKVPSLDLSASDEAKKAEEKQGDNDLTTKEKDTAPQNKRDSSIKEKQLQRKQNARRRRSFDSQIWTSITSMRTKQSDNAAAASNLREGIIPSSKSKDEQDGNSSKSTRRRRHSFDPDGAARGSIDAKEKANAYGNMALEYDMMLSGLKELQSEYLNQFKFMIGCEKASIFFINELTREMVLFTDTGEHFRLPPASGIAGICAETGMCMNIPDAYADERFNR